MTLPQLSFADMWAEIGMVHGWQHYNLQSVVATMSTAYHRLLERLEEERGWTSAFRLPSGWR